MYECKHDAKQQTDFKLNSYKCADLNDLELYNVHAESFKIEKEKGTLSVQNWIILSTDDKSC